MLANILPGFRELRTPLIAGYLWLTVVWIAVGGADYHPSGSKLGRAIESLARFGGRGEVLAAMSLAAYMIGILSTSLAQAMLNALGRMAERRAANLVERRSDYIGRLNEIAVSRVGLRIGEGAYATTSGNVTTVTVNRADGTTFRHHGTVGDAWDRFERSLAELPDPIRFDDVLQGADYAAFRDAYLDFASDCANTEQRASPEAPTSESRLREDCLIIVRLMVATEISTRLRADLAYALTRLIGIEQDLYTSLDRLDAEAILRCTIAIPLAALIMTSAVAYDSRSLLLLPVSLALFVLGLRKRNSAMTGIALAIHTGRLRSPVLDAPIPIPASYKTADQTTGENEASPKPSEP